MLFLWQVDWLAVLVSSFSGFAIGALWYSPLLFSKPWAEMMGFTKKGMKSDKMMVPGPMVLVRGYVAIFLVAVFLAVFQNTLGVFSVMEGLKVAVFACLGFTIPVQLMMWNYSGKEFKLFLIDAGYQFVLFSVIGTILAVM